MTCKATTSQVSYISPAHPAVKPKISDHIARKRLEITENALTTLKENNSRDVCRADFFKVQYGGQKLDENFNKLF